MQLGNSLCKVQILTFANQGMTIAKARRAIEVTFKFQLMIAYIGLGFKYYLVGCESNNIELIIGYFGGYTH